MSEEDVRSGEAPTPHHVVCFADGKWQRWVVESENPNGTLVLRQN